VLDLGEDVVLGPGGWCREMMSTMDRVPVTSENLASVGYEPATNVLEIEFRRGVVYRYFGVPRSVFQGLMASSSKGTFFVEAIRDQFAFERVP